MAISVQCAECFETFSVRDELAGKKVRCKSCGGTILVERATSKKVAHREAEDEFDETPQIESSAVIPRRAAKNKKKTRGKIAAWWSSLDFTNQETQTMLLTSAVTALLVFLTLVAFLDSRASLLLYRAGLYVGLPAVIVVGMFGTALEFDISFLNAALRWIVCLGIGWVVLQIEGSKRGVQKPKGKAKSQKGSGLK